MKYTESQIKAINSCGKNILVSAGAGSGKTGVLKARVLEKLSQGVHIDELVILTFTNAAAFEMRTRIIDSIKDNPRYQEELKRINRAVISTFDAFCLQLVKEYHYLLGLPENITIGDQILIRQMEKSTLDMVIKTHYQNHDEQFEKLVLDHFQNGDSLIVDTVQKLATKLKKEPNWLEHADDFIGDHFRIDRMQGQFSEFEALIRNQLEEAEILYSDLISALETHGGDPVVKFIEQLEMVFRPFLTAADYDSFSQQLSSLQYPRRPNTRNDEALKELLDSYYDPLKEFIKKKLKAIPESLFAYDKNAAIAEVFKTKDTVAVIVALAKEYLIKLETIKKEKNLFDYQDIMDLAIRLLEENPSIRNAYRDSIDEIMIDEYQDTNDLQVYFVNLIAKNNLFMVGDMKQSIYGFRDANPQNFLDRYLEYRQGGNGLAIDLRENFRSRRQVLDDINRIFTVTMDRQIGGIDYQDGQSLVYGLKKYDHQKADQNYGIELLKYDFPKLKAEDSEADRMRIEGQMLANDIMFRIENGYQIFDTDKDTFRNIRYSDIAILVDRKTDFEKISQILSHNGIPVNLYSEEPFIESPELLFLTSYLKLLKCYIDENYLKTEFAPLLYSVARSFVYRISDQEIIRLLTENEFHNKTDLEVMTSSPVFANLHATAKLLAGMVAEITNEELLFAICRELNLYIAVSNLENPEKKAEKLDYFIETVGNLEGFDFHDLIGYLDLLEENPDWDIEYSPVHPQLEAVKLMTMHKSKGLQFKVVYVLGLAKKFNFQENRDYFIYDKEIGLIGNVSDNGYYSTFQRYVYLERSRRQYISERIRLLYVTMTRAEENLILLVDIDKLKQGKTEKDLNGYVRVRIRSDYRSYSDLLAGVDLSTFPSIVQADSASLAKPATVAAPEEGTISIEPFTYITSEIATESYSKKTDELLDDTSIRIMEYGERIHQLLEQVDFRQRDHWPSNLPPIIEEHLENLIDSGILHLHKSPRILKEVEFCYRDAQGTHHGIIDLLVITADKAIIIDYKLKNLDDQAYEKQLRGYRDYVANTLKMPVECYLFALITSQLSKIF